MTGDPLSDLRSALISRGMDPEGVNDMVMALGGASFTKHVTALTRAAERAEARSEYQPTALAACFEYEMLLRLLGVDSAELGSMSLMAAVSTVHHLLDHAAATGCGVALHLAEQDPLRIQSP